MTCVQIGVLTSDSIDFHCVRVVCMRLLRRYKYECCNIATIYIREKFQSPANFVTEDDDVYDFLVSARCVLCLRSIHIHYKFITRQWQPTNKTVLCAVDNCDSHFFLLSSLSHLLSAFSFAFAVADFLCVRTISYRLLWHRKLWILNFSKWFYFFAHWVGHRLNSSSHRRQFHICPQREGIDKKECEWWTDDG